MIRTIILAFALLAASRPAMAEQAEIPATVGILLSSVTLEDAAVISIAPVAGVRRYRISGQAGQLIHFSVPDEQLMVILDADGASYVTLPVAMSRAREIMLSYD